MIQRTLLKALGVVTVCVAAWAGHAGAQEALDRTALSSGAWTGIPGSADVHLRQLVWRAAPGAPLVSTSNLSFGFTPHARALMRGIVAFQSGTVATAPTEWEVGGVVRIWDQQRGAPATVGGIVGWNGAAESFDAGVSVARWMGPARVLLSSRAFTNAYEQTRARAAIGLGTTLHPRAGALPIAINADVVSLTDRVAGEYLAWSAGVSAGIGHTSHTVMLFATNATSATLQGSSRGTANTRYGVEITLPMGLGRLFGWYPDRGTAAQAVRGDPTATPAASVEMRRYLFEPRLVEIAVGEAVEWINRDEVVHTVNAEDGAWQSGAIPAGARWRARFDRPGTYVYYCGPHPYMRGAVIVR